MQETWKNNKNFKGTNKNYSVSKVLRDKKKTNDEFETIFNSLSLEEVISLKLELAAKASGNKMYGMPIYKYLDLIVKDAIIKYALSACHSKAEAQNFLGLSSKDWMELLKGFNPDPYFDEEKLESS
jgi:predicted CopG family antitoxin